MNKTPVNILGIGHPRTGTKYTAKLLQSWGLDVGHEEWRKDGIVAWQSLISPYESAVKSADRMPYMEHNIKLDLVEFKQVIHSIRDPKTAIPSIVKTEGGSQSWRSLWVPFSIHNKPVENAILSVVYTDLRIEGFYPDRFTYKIESEADQLFEYLSQHFDLTESERPSKSTNKKRDYKTEDIDWNIRPRFKELIDQYCDKYSYPRLDI